MIPVCSTSGDDTIGSFDFFWATNDVESCETSTLPKQPLPTGQQRYACLQEARHARQPLLHQYHGRAQSLAARTAAARPTSGVHPASSATASPATTLTANAGSARSPATAAVVLGGRVLAMPTVRCLQAPPRSLASALPTTLSAEMRRRRKQPSR